MSTEPQSTPPPSQPEPPEPEVLAQHAIRRTRLAGLWIAVGFFAVVLLFLLIFILQNDKTVDIAYLGAHGRLSLGVALLLSAVCGVLLTILAGTARISQLRAAARRHRRADARRAAGAPADPPGLSPRALVCCLVPALSPLPRPSPRGLGCGRSAGPPRAADL